MAIRVCSIFSGSSGNCTYIESGNSAILIDAGSSLKRIKQGVEAVGGSLEKVRGIFITHEHGDHIRGLKALTNKYPMPIISNKETLCEIVRMYPDINLDLFLASRPGCTAAADEFSVKSFPIPHDSVCPMGYCVETGGKKIIISTDMGHITDEYINIAKGAHCAVIEANYDYDMLMNGPYPPPLKRRVAGDRGHLDNRLCGEAVARLTQSGAEHILLAHLSRENNTPAVAVETVCRVLGDYGITRGKDVTVNVAPRYEPSAICL